MIECCRDCNERHIGCHSTCNRYIKEKYIHEREKFERGFERRIVGGIYEQRSIAINKILKHRRKGSKIYED